VLCFCFVFLRLVYSMLPISLDVPFLITPSVFSNVYAEKKILFLASIFIMQKCMKLETHYISVIQLHRLN